MRKYIIGLIVLLLFVGIASAGNNSELLKPGMGRVWLQSQGTDIHETLNYLLGGIVVVTLIAYVVFTGKAGIWLMANSTTMGDPREKSHAQNAMLHVLYALVAIVLLIKIGITFFGWY
jgi:hypothetical protein